MKIKYKLRSLTRGKRMTVYISDSLHRIVKKKNLPVSRILEKALRDHITEGEDSQFHYQENRILKKRMKEIRKLTKLD